jgi:hypothetical protein
MDNSALLHFWRATFTPLGGGIVQVINTAALPNPATGVGSTQMGIGHVVGGIAFAELPDHDANVMRDAQAERARTARCTAPDPISRPRSSAATRCKKASRSQGAIGRAAAAVRDLLFRAIGADSA